MRLADWSVSFYRLPYDRRIVWANAIESSGTFVLLKLVAEDGAIGVAEGTIKPTWSGASLRTIAAALEDLFVPILRGVDIVDPAAVASALAAIPENRLAKQLIDNACWGLRASVAGMPLWRFWGGAGEVELTWSVTRQPPSVMATEAAAMCRRYGFGTLKVKGGQGVQTDLDALREIRAAVGPAVELYVDANGAYPREAALDYVCRIAELGVTVAEDPCPLAPDALFEALQRECPLPILVDSSCTSLRDAALFVERGARALMTKPGRIGYSEARAIGVLGTKVAVGLYAESALGTIISSQLAAALPRTQCIAAAEQTFFLVMRERITRDPPVIRAGRLLLPDTTPDALVDWQAVKRFEIRP